jgi:psiF repeat
MKKTLAALLVALPFAFVATTAHAEEKAPSKQQSKFGACSKEAKSKGLKGDERKAFMKTCAKKDKSAEKSAPAK